eukprot:s3445_g4.t3
MTSQLAAPPRKGRLRKLIDVDAPAAALDVEAAVPAAVSPQPKKAARQAKASACAGEEGAHSRKRPLPATQASFEIPFEPVRPRQEKERRPSQAPAPKERRTQQVSRAPATAKADVRKAAPQPVPSPVASCEPLKAVAATPVPTTLLGSRGQPALRGRVVPGDTVKITEGDQEDDADKRLEIMLQRQLQRIHEEPPAWAVQLQSALLPRLAQVDVQLQTIGARLDTVEQTVPGRMERVEGQMADLLSQFKQLKRGHAEVPPPAQLDTHAGQPQKPTAAQTVWGDDTDFCHIVCGGWPEDTMRAMVESDTWCLVKKMTVAQVDRVICYGRRCHTSHIILPSLPKEASRERFYALQECYNKTVSTTVPGAQLIWMSPSRTPALRARNRATTGAFNKLQSLLPGDGSMIEADYSKQLIFVGDRRGAANAQNQLRAQPTEKVISAPVARGQDDAVIRYYFNLDVIAKAVQKDVGVVEAAILTE